MLLLGTSANAQQSAPWPMVREFGGAIPINQNKWFTAKDYPLSAMQKGDQGNVVVKFDIDVDGRAKNCELDISTGFKSLDSVPCHLIEKRARFKPALGSDHMPVVAKGRYSVAFWIPQ